MLNTLHFISINPWPNSKSRYCSPHGKINRRRRKRWTHHTDDFMNNLGADKTICRARYQQSPVEVYAKFLAKDQVNGNPSSAHHVFNVKCIFL